VAKTTDVVLSALDCRSEGEGVEYTTWWAIERIKGEGVGELGKKGGKEKRRKRIKTICISQKNTNEQKNAFRYLHTPHKHSK
jgi:hypothetical protein